MKLTVKNYKDDKYYQKIVNAFNEILKVKNTIIPIDILTKLDVIKNENLKRWKEGQIPYLEKNLNCNLSKANRILRIISYHPHDLNLIRKIGIYNYKKKELQFSKTNDKNIELAYKTHFVLNKKKMTLDKPPKNSITDPKQCIYASPDRL